MNISYSKYFEHAKIQNYKELMIRTQFKSDITKGGIAKIPPP